MKKNIVNIIIACDSMYVNDWSYREAERQLNIPRTTLHRWVTKYLPELDPQHPLLRK